MDASKYAGINEKRGIVLSMVIAGALAGIGGSFLYLARTGKSIEVIDRLAPEGFAGISVALLGLSNPIGIVFSSVFIAHITQGGFYAQRLNFKPEIIEIMTAVIIYFSAFSLMVRTFFSKREEKRNIKAGEELGNAGEKKGFGEEKVLDESEKDLKELQDEELQEKGGDRK
jgi:ABC-type uncharacterized transport system permease subunit